jgi:hypothetical protein
VALHQDWAVSLPRYCERQRTYALSDVRLYRMLGARSPRAAMVAANAPITGDDAPGLIARKLAKRALASRRRPDAWRFVRWSRSPSACLRTARSRAARTTRR